MNIRKIEMHEAIIKNPDPAVVYTIIRPNLIKGQVTVTFSGKNIKDIDTIDVAHLQYIKKGDDRIYPLANDACIILTKELLPASLQHISSSGFLIYEKITNKLSEITGIHFDINDAGNLRYRIYMGYQRPAPLKYYSDALVAECRGFIGKRTVTISSLLPIFEEIKRPRKKILDSIYQQFCAYNPPSKLEYQFKISYEMCHARAHFIYLLLMSVGITSYKVFKMWHKNAWHDFPIKRDWSYHVAVMIEDSKKRKWIWDPWIENGNKLIPLKEWLTKSNEPIPIQVMVSSPAVAVNMYKLGCPNIISTRMGNYNSACTLLSFKNRQSRFFDVIQAMIGNAIPNKIQRFSLFARNDQSIKKDEPTNAVIKCHLL